MGRALPDGQPDIDAADIGGRAVNHRSFRLHAIHEGNRRHHNIGNGRAFFHIIHQLAHAFGLDGHLDAGLLGIGRRQIQDAGIVDHAGREDIDLGRLGQRR